MVDKVFSFDKADLDRCIGCLSEEDMVCVSEKLKAVLGLHSDSQTREVLP